MSKNWIVMDLDGTLCDCSHRVHWAQAKQWDEFNAGIPEDKVNEDAAEFARAISDNLNYDIILCTGRDEKHRQATEKWLHDHGLSHLFTQLLMRPEGTRDSDHEVKVKLIDEFFGTREAALDAVLLVLDDRDKVVEAFRDAGFRCWQVQAGSY